MSSSKAGGANQLDPTNSSPDIPMISGDRAHDSISDERDKTSMDPLESADAAVEDLTSTMSTLRFVPPSVRFGRGGRRGGLSRS